MTPGCLFSRFHLVLLVLEHNRKGEVGVVELLEGAVDQGLVQVEHQGELWARPGLEGQRRMPAAHFRGQRWQVLDEEVRVKLLPVFRLRLRLRGVDLHLRIKLLIIIQMRLTIRLILLIISFLNFTCWYGWDCKGGGAE